MRKAFFIVSVLVLVAIGVQYYLAGIGFFSEGQQGLGEHGMTGRFVLPVLFILLILTAAIARAGKSTIWLTVLMLVLLVFQTLIFIFTGMIFGSMNPLRKFRSPRTSRSVSTRSTRCLCSGSAP